MLETDTNNVLCDSVLKILGNPIRIKILQYALNGIKQKYLKKLLGISRPGISRHIDLLESIGVLEVKYGYNREKILTTIHSVIKFKILPIPSDDDN